MAGAAPWSPPPGWQLPPAALDVVSLAAPRAPAGPSRGRPPAEAEDAPQRLQQSWRARSEHCEVNPETGERTAVYQWEKPAFTGPDVPAPRSGHTIVVDEGRGKAVMHGGMTGNAARTPDDVSTLSDTWILDLRAGTCSKVDAALADERSAPAGTFGHAAVLLGGDSGWAAGGEPAMVLHGGQLAGGRTSSQFLILERCFGERPFWRRLVATGIPPLPRWGHSLVSLSRDGSEWLFVYGGSEGIQGASDSFSDVHLIGPDLTWSSPSHRTLRPSAGPRGRRRHVATVGDDGRMWIFGGRCHRGGSASGQTFMNDVWALDPETLTWEQVHPGCDAREADDHELPLPRTGQCGIAHGGNIYIFGGYTQWRSVQGLQVHDDLWRFDSRERRWARVSPLVAPPHPSAAAPRCCPDRPEGCREEPPRRRSMAAAFLFADRLYIHGGRDDVGVFTCCYSLPLPARPAVALVEHVAHYLAAHRGSYHADSLPPELVRYCDSLFAPTTVLEHRPTPDFPTEEAG